MNETGALIPLPDETRLTHAAVRDAYAASDDRHPDLLQHMERLAEQEGRQQRVGATALRDVHEKQAPSPAEQARALRDKYGLSDVLSLDTTDGPHRDDLTVQDLTADFDTFKSLLVETDLPIREYPHTEGSVVGRSSKALRRYADHYLAGVAGWPANIRRDQLDAARERILLQESDADLSDTIDYRKYRDMLVKATNNTAGLDERQLQLVHDKAGILNFDHYNPKQLERMANLAAGDPETVNYLKEGDVTVVFSDARGDYTNAAAPAKVAMEGPNGRTLYFEVSKRSDINRARVLLQRLGIKASTVAFIGHGEPGITQFGDTQHPFYMTVESADHRDRDVSLAHMDFMPALVEDMMQDSKGVDDDVSTKGRRRMILLSCDGATKTGASPGVSGTEESLGTSTAHALALAAKHPNLDVYGAAAPLAVRKINGGLEMIMVQGNKEFLLDVSKLSVTPEGKIKEDTAPAIALFNVKPEPKFGDPDFWGTL
jgi:hypothetical protein